MNRVWRLARGPPAGWPSDGDFVLGDEAIPEPGAGQVLTRTIYLSMDPYQWGRRRSGAEAAGDVCHGRTVSQVVRSRADEYQGGDFLFNTNSWQLYGLTGRNIDVCVRDFVAEHQDRFLDEMAAWIRDGAVKYREDIREGLEQSPAAFSAMLAGGNFGKTLVRVSDDPTASPGTRILERGLWR